MVNEETYRWHVEHLCDTMQLGLGEGGSSEISGDDTKLEKENFRVGRNRQGLRLLGVPFDRVQPISECAG